MASCDMQDRWHPRLGGQQASNASDFFGAALELPVPARNVSHKQRQQQGKSSAEEEQPSLMLPAAIFQDRASSEPPRRQHVEEPSHKQTQAEARLAMAALGIPGGVGLQVSRRAFGANSGLCPAKIGSGTKADAERLSLEARDLAKLPGKRHHFPQLEEEVVQQARQRQRSPEVEQCDIDSIRHRRRVAGAACRKQSPCWDADRRGRHFFDRRWDAEHFADLLGRPAGTLKAGSTTSSLASVAEVAWQSTKADAERAAEGQAAFGMAACQADTIIKSLLPALEAVAEEEEAGCGLGKARRQASSSTGTTCTPVASRRNSGQDSLIDLEASALEFCSPAADDEDEVYDEVPTGSKTLAKQSTRQRTAPAIPSSSSAGSSLAYHRVLKSLLPADTISTDGDLAGHVAQGLQALVAEGRPRRGGGGPSDGAASFPLTQARRKQAITAARGEGALAAATASAPAASMRPRRV
eukprot:CAMPEP_0178401298 /NCGR_PEP_ID=MMETSP0689_2-20121128/16230_1 /TAXON_ID=160604 /ORGANISM="Amphidinium massartii, Strain CS-259" /LENGTH=467 /DNA_ID=CAMNT_0020022115 /DNA_START=120 /DNA_END=1523 /DNA_ORIENTATION=-